MKKRRLNDTPQEDKSNELILTQEITQTQTQTQRGAGMVQW